MYMHVCILYLHMHAYALAHVCMHGLAQNQIHCLHMYL